MMVYLARNKLNDKVYVGQTVHSLRSRILRHVYAARINTKLRFSQAIRYYGIKAFEFKIIFRSSDANQINEVEKFLIRVLKTQNPILGYNIASGGKVSRGYKKTPAQIKHLLGNKFGKGLVSNYQKRKTSEAKKEWWRRHPEAKKALGAYARKRLLGNTIWIGRKHTDATKKKLSQIRRLYWLRKKAA